MREVAACPSTAPATPVPASRLGAPRLGCTGGRRPLALAVAWRAALLLPVLLLARGDVVLAHLPWHGVQVQLLNADPWVAIWLTPHISVHLVLYDDVILAAIATGMALLWVLMRTGAPGARRARPAGGLPFLAALVGPGAACG